MEWATKWIFIPLEVCLVAVIFYGPVALYTVVATLAVLNIDSVHWVSLALTGASFGAAGAVVWSTRRPHVSLMRKIFDDYMPCFGWGSLIGLIFAQIAYWMSHH